MKISKAPVVGLIAAVAMLGTIPAFASQKDLRYWAPSAPGDTKAAVCMIPSKENADTAISVVAQSLEDCLALGGTGTLM